MNAAAGAAVDDVGVAVVYDGEIRRPAWATLQPLAGHRDRQAAGRRHQAAQLRRRVTARPLLGRGRPYLLPVTTETARRGH